MSCLVIRIHKLDDQLHGRAELASGQLYGRAELASGQLYGRAELASSQLHGRAELASGQLHGRAELICTESGLPRLLVSPEVVWLTPSNNFSADFSVKSNVDWEIV